MRSYADGSGRSRLTTRSTDEIEIVAGGEEERAAARSVSSATMGKAITGTDGNAAADAIDGVEGIN